MFIILLKKKSLKIFFPNIMCDKVKLTCFSPQQLQVKMYDPILAKSFSRYHRRYDRRRLGCFALLLSLIAALSISSTFKLKPTLPPHHFTLSTYPPSLSPHFAKCFHVGEPPKLQLSINAAESMLLDEAIIINSPQTIWDGNYCEMEGDVVIDPNSSTIFLIRPRSAISSTNTATSWIVEPYPIRRTRAVRNWTVKLADDDDASVPKCNQMHSHTALLFSMGGRAGNHFHDFSDVLVPLFATSFQYKREVQFLITDLKPTWTDKYRPLLNSLSRHVIVRIGRFNKTALCYKRLIAGLNFHGDFALDPASGASMHQFRQLLRRTYSLDRNKAIEIKEGEFPCKPRLMIVSRKDTRILMNEDQISRAARELGFEVVSAEMELSMNLTKFAQVVNSFDVMLGIHGAGLTNMVFLPDKAVVIQIVPLGDIDIFGKLQFGNPSGGMNLRYLEYEIETKESSLIERYGLDDPVIKDPMSVHSQGWEKIKEVYLNNQNVTIDIRRFRPTLLKALKLLRR